MAGLFFRTEPNSRFHQPWFELRGVRNTTLIVLLQARGKICCATRVVARRVSNTLENIDVVMFFWWHAKP